MTSIHDTVVVGAGALGLSTAFMLTKRGAQVAIVAPCNGEGAATRAAGAMIDAFGEIEKLDSRHERDKLDFEVQCQRRYPSWLAEIEASSGRSIFSQSGIVVIANAGGEHDIPKMALMRRMMDEYGEVREDIELSDIKGLLPHPSYRAHEAFFMPTARAVDTRDLLDALEIALSRSDLATRIDQSVVRVEQDGTGWAAVTDDGTRVASERIVVCAGAHTLRLIPDDRLRVPKLYFGRGSSVTVVDGPHLPYTLRTPNRALSCGIHMVPQAEGRLYLGATNLFGMNFDNLPKGPTVGELHTLFEAIQNELNTTLRNISIESVHSGLRPVSQFDEPLCGETNLEGLFIGTGTHRTGVHMSPIIAEILADAVTDRTSGVANPFDPKRDFRTNERIDLRLGVRSLIATILFPTGKLPYNRMEEIETYVTELLSMVTRPEAANGEIEAFRQILKQVPLDEQGVLQTYHHVLERRLSGYGPFPS